MSSARRRSPPTRCWCSRRSTRSVLTTAPARLRCAAQQVEVTSGGRAAITAATRAFIATQGDTRRRPADALPRRKPRHIGHIGDGRANGDAEHLTDIRGGVGAAQQHAPRIPIPASGQVSRPNRRARSPHARKGSGTPCRPAGLRKIKVRHQSRPGVSGASPRAGAGAVSGRSPSALHRITASERPAPCTSGSSRSWSIRSPGCGCGYGHRRPLPACRTARHRPACQARSQAGRAGPRSRP